MLSRRALIASGVLGLLPWRLREAFAAARLRGPMVGHVAPTEAFIWVYTGRHPDVWVNYRKKATPVSTTRRVRVVASNGHKAVLTGLEPDTTDGGLDEDSITDTLAACKAKCAAWGRAAPGTCINDTHHAMALI